MEKCILIFTKTLDGKSLEIPLNPHEDMRQRSAREKLKTEMNQEITKCLKF